MPSKRTYADRAEYLKMAVAKRRRKLKQMVVEYKGGKCILCGYNRYFGAFDLHHTGDSPKAFGLSMKGITRSWEKTRAEADKCVLLCANCHREVHGGITQLPTATLVEKRGEFGETLTRKTSGQSRAKLNRKIQKV